MKTGAATPPPGAATLSRGMHRVQLGLMRGVAAGTARLSAPASERLGRLLGWIYGTLVRYHRADALEALQRAFPDAGAARIKTICDRMYANLGRHAVEVLQLAGGRCGLVEEVDIQGAEHVAAALQQGRGGLVLTAHLGNWDLLSVAAAAAGYRLTIITKEVRNPAVDYFWNDMRTRYGLRMVPAHNSYRRCLAALRRNELVGFILDQNMIAREGVFVDFFDRPACTTPGLAFMSAHTRAPVIPAFARRLENGRHRVTVYPALDPPADRDPETLRAATQLYTRLIEDAIRDDPDQWIWIHRRWRTRPRPENR